jgi:hypothetical protein
MMVGEFGFSPLNTAGMNWPLTMAGFSEKDLHAEDHTEMHEQG